MKRANPGARYQISIDGIPRAYRNQKDIAVAIAWLRREYDLRVAYVDLDAHHGDGVQWGFYDDPNVLTISIHARNRSHCGCLTGSSGNNDRGDCLVESTSILPEETL